jgi:tRNA (mo5U34)-methyltransferase
MSLFGKSENANSELKSIKEMKIPLPPPPKSFDAYSFFAGISWHQGWDIFDGVRVPGRNPVEELCEYVQLPKDMTGMRVLDIGAWHGCFSFECERRGAKEILAYSLENPEKEGFNKLKAILGSKVQYQLGSVYELSRDKVGEFDIVLFLGVLYHLRYPLLAFDKIRNVCKGTCFVETHVCDNCFIPAGKTSREAVTLEEISPLLLNTPIWQFYKYKELNDDISNWFGPNICAVINAMETSGFRSEFLHSWGCRASFRGTPVKSLSECWEHAYDASDTVQKSVGIK